MWSRVRDEPAPWDLLIIGGGATGLGCAVDAAHRGYRTLLVERGDFALGTSSRSTKLIHGGVRYLQQGNIPLVMESLKERGILRQNAPHLVHDLAFVVPNYDWWEAPFYGVGMKVYDLLAGKYGFGSSRVLSKDETIAVIPTIETEGLRGGVRYYDGQFDDARLAMTLAHTAREQGATLLNHCPAVALTKDDDGMVHGARLRDAESGTEIEVRARVVINATGPWTDEVRHFDEPHAEPMIRPSQGVHVVLDRSFLPGDHAIMVPQTADGRVLFAIPWHRSVVVGTTDTPIADTPIEPQAFPEEIEFILSHARDYLTRDPSDEDVKSIFVGIRPLVAAGGGESTAALSRDHTLHVSRSGLVTVAGGKWTTYRHMAEDVIDQAATLAGLDPVPCDTRELRLHGYTTDWKALGDLWPYGSDAERIDGLARDRPELRAPLHDALGITGAQVVWAVRYEMARTVDDVLSRRTRSLLFDARAAERIAPSVARLMADELERDADWVARQTASFEALARSHRLPLT